jgi:hypothetical protein
MHRRIHSAFAAHLLPLHLLLLAGASQACMQCDTQYLYCSCVSASWHTCLPLLIDFCHEPHLLPLRLLLLPALLLLRPLALQQQHRQQQQQQGKSSEEVQKMFQTKRFSQGGLNKRVDAAAAMAPGSKHSHRHHTPHPQLYTLHATLHVTNTARYPLHSSHIAVKRFSSLTCSFSSCCFCSQNFDDTCNPKTRHNTSSQI